MQVGERNVGLKAVIVAPAVSSTTVTTSTTLTGTGGINIVVVNAPSPTDIYLPPVPALNQVYVIQDGSMNASVNNITVHGNGNNINVPTGVSPTYVIGENGTDAWFNGNGTAWGLLA